MRKYHETRATTVLFVIESGGRLGPLAIKVLRNTFRDSALLTGVYQMILTQLIRQNDTAIARAKEVVGVLPAPVPGPAGGLGTA